MGLQFVLKFMQLHLERVNRKEIIDSTIHP